MSAPPSPRCCSATSNPSGKLPVTFPTVAGRRAGRTPPRSGRAPTTRCSTPRALKVGYRWYDAQNITPLFPFGFGLSYTTFGFSNLQVGALTGGKATVTATVTNTGSRAGTEVVQLYVGDAGRRSVSRRTSCATSSGSRSTPAQAQTVTFTVTAHDLAHWDTTRERLDARRPARYQILVGDSSRNLPLSGTLAVPAALTATPDGRGRPTRTA